MAVAPRGDRLGRVNGVGWRESCYNRAMSPFHSGPAQGLYLAFALILLGCGPDKPGTTGGSSGAGVTPEDTECGAAEPLAVQLGEGVGSAFRQFEAGDRLRLDFASQAGLEAAVNVRTLGLAPEAVESIVLKLEVEGSPIGESTTSGASLRCEDLWSQVDTALPIDVTSHPTVASVAQLADVEAELVVEVHDLDGIVIESVTAVVLDP